LADAPGGRPDVILIGTGSEVAPCLAAAEILAKENVQARIVSLPSWELFDRQDEAYRESVLPKAIRPRVAVEAGSPRGWERYAGTDGAILAMHRFGVSAPLKDVMNFFGFAADHIAALAREQIAKWKNA
jgi:transketolase